MGCTLKLDCHVPLKTRPYASHLQLMRKYFAKGKKLKQNWDNGH